MRARKEIDSISESWPEDAKYGISDIRITAVAGGSDRIESVQLALKNSGGADIVLVHDAARALTPPDVFRRVVSAVRAGAEAVVPVLPMTDTVRRAETRRAETPLAETPQAKTPRTATPRTATPRADADSRQVVVDSGAEFDQNLPTVEVLHGDLDRSILRRVQTPQGFTARTLRRAHDRYEDDLAAAGPGAVVATDDAGLVEHLGVDVVAVDGDEEALKITYPLDLVLGEHIAQLRDAEICNLTEHDWSTSVTGMHDAGTTSTMRDATSERGQQR